MLILAIETSTELASCALWRDGKTDERFCKAGEASSATLLPTVAALMDAAGVRVADLDAIAFGAGPGSFTGLRIACGIAQGLAYPHAIPLIAVDTLAAIAEASGAAQVMAVLDARMREVYFAHYRRVGDDLLAVAAAAVAPPNEIPPPAAGWTVCGNALAAYPELRERCAAAADLLPEVMPTAAAVAVLGARSLRAGCGIPAAQAAPIYVRDKVAFTTAERLAAGGRA